MRPISLTKTMNSTLSKALLSIMHFLFRLKSNWQVLREWLRSFLLKIILSCIYFFIVTPIAWETRRNARDLTKSWKSSVARVGWVLNEQSTSDRDGYVTQSCGNEYVVMMMYSTRHDWVRILLKLRCLADPPKGRELSTDLYVMF